MFWKYLGILADIDGVFHDIAQLPHIAWKIIAHKDIEGPLGVTANPPTGLLGEEI